MREKVETLKHHSDFFANEPDIGVWIGYPLIIDPYVAGGQMLETIDAAQHRALSAAGWADDQDHLTLFYFETRAFQRHYMAELFAGVLYANAGKFRPARQLICVAQVCPP
jgi:hypothetical protein